MTDETGKPLYWSLFDHMHAIEQMIKADELQEALRMCENVPGWYRDNYPPELAALKAELYTRIYDQIEYASDDEEASCVRQFGEEQWTNGYMFPRAEIVRDIVKELKCPWIFDLGCSHGNLPLGLMQEKLDFHYKGVGLNSRIVSKVKEWVVDHWAERPQPGQPTILYCTEVIEHCFNPHDIVHSAYKVGMDWDVILLSVPKYTLGGGLPDWRRRLGHVRTWTPKEFSDFAAANWRGRKWTLYDSASMVIVGRK